jgi:HAD superfamily hydrolase (TIGR01509 family)
VTIAAVIFDMDGVLVDSEAAWNEARHEVTLQSGGRWRDDAQRKMMGMSSTEWSAYLRDELGVAMAPQEISDAVVARLSALYEERLPLLPGAVDAVQRVAEAWPLGLASSANRPIIDLVLERAGLSGVFAATVSSEEVPRGKPAADVYLEAARRLDVEPRECAAIEDSSNGLRSAAAAGMKVIALPNKDFPPAGDALALAADILGSLDDLTPERISGG